MAFGLPCFQHTATKVGLFRDGHPNINVRFVKRHYFLLKTTCYRRDQKEKQLGWLASMSILVGALKFSKTIGRTGPGQTLIKHSAITLNTWVKPPCEVGWQAHP
ncbi:hypothetical protein YC2023_022321 [Brassica napus]